jgi:hypothetical protein
MISLFSVLKKRTDSAVKDPECWNVYVCRLPRTLQGDSRSCLSFADRLHFKSFSLSIVLSNSELRNEYSLIKSVHDHLTIAD